MPWTFPVGSMLGDSRSLVLRVHLPKAGITKTTAFDAQMTVGQACERIRAQVRESDQTDGAKDYGLFLPHEDNKKGLWLDNSRTLEHYILRNGDTVEYRYRFRWLYIRTMDGTRKTLKVDDSKTVAELMLMICTKMGIYNYEEYLLARERDETDKERTMTLKRSTGHTGTMMRDQEKMEKLKRKLHTDDDMEWLNPSQSLRQQGVDEKEVLLLKRRYFFSDMNVDARDPVQLNLLYVQLKDAILKGTHPVSLEEAIYLAGIQCQVQFGNYVAEKFKPNFLDLKDFLPKEYAKIRSLERKIFQQHAEFCGLTEVEAKVKYCQFCRSLKTYGITFFLVKERIKGKNKLIPRLLGITKDSVVRLDEKTKEVLKIWPLTSICKWAASPHAFTMDFGEYSPDEYYTAQTSEGEQVSQLIAGYIDIILKKQKATDHPGLQGDEESAMYEENVQAERATIVHHQRAPVKGRGRDSLVNGVVEKSFEQKQQQRSELSSDHQIHINDAWSTHQQNNIGLDGNSTLVDGQSVLTTTTRQMSPDNFMTGGTHIFHYQEMSPAQRSLLVTINEDLETLQAAKEQLDIGPPTERPLLGVGKDEASKRWLSESMGASQAKVTDEVGAMNAAVAQALRSANRAESVDVNVVQHGQPLDQIRDPGDDLMMMQQSFRVVTIHFPAFVDDLKRVAVLRRESGALKADQTGQPIVAEQTEESTQNLLSAARHVADAFTDLLQSARPLAMGQSHEEIYPTSEDGNYQVNNRVTSTTQQGPVSSTSRKAIIEAASRVGAASNDLLRHVMHCGDDDESFNSNYLILTDEERIYQDQLLGLAKAVANTTAGLVVKAKVLASQITSDPEAQQRVIASVTQTGLCTSQLVACTKVLAPTIHQPTCQQQLIEAAREVTWAVDGVVQASRAAVLVPSDDPQMVQQSIIETETAATEVRDALDQLNAHLIKGSFKGYQGDALNSFQTAYEDLKQYYTTDGQRMVASARRLAQATALIIADIKAQAEESGDDSDKQNHLFHAAKQLADATTNLISAAKACSSNPDNIQLQTELRDTADELNTLAYSAGAEQFQTRLVYNLQTAARATVTGATQLVNISQASTKYSRGNSYQLHNDTRNVTNLIPKTVIKIRESRANPNDPMTLLELIGACERFIQPCTAMVRSSKSLAPTLSDPAIQAALENSNSQLASALETLVTCLIRAAPLARHLQLDGALARLTRLSEEVTTMETSLVQGVLAPIPEQKVEDCCHLLNASVHNGTESARQLESVINALANMDSATLSQPELAGQSADLLASAIAGLVQATRGIIADQNGLVVGGTASSSPHVSSSAAESTRRAVVQDARQAVQLSYELVRAAKDTQIACDSNQPANAATVHSHSQQLTSQLIETLTRCLRGLPGHREISEATHLIEQKRSQLIQFSQPNQTRLTARFVEPNEYQKRQTDLTQAAVEFNQATGDLLSSYSPGTFRRTTRRFTGAYDHLTDKGIELSACNEISSANQQAEPVVNSDLLNGLINVSDQSYILMNEASRVCAQPEAENLRGKFQSAARDVTESISQLLTICTSGVSVDQRECEAALRRLETLRPLLQNPNRPLNQHSYYDCVDAVAKSLEPLAESLRSMSTSAREQRPNEFSSAVRQCANSVCQLVEETAQAAYLIGSADRNDSRREGGTGGIAPASGSLVDLDLFIQSQTEIQNACDAICEPSVNNRQVIALSTEMARSAKILCEACSQVSNQTTNIDARQRLNNLTKQTMQSITSLIQHRGSTVATDVNGEWSECNRQQTWANAQGVSANVANLVKLITTEPQFSDLIISHKQLTNATKEAQRPVCVAGLESLNATQTVLRAAQNLVTTSRMGSSENSFIAFSTASKDLSNSIKVLATAMRENAPGQRECQRVSNNIRKLLHELQDARIASMENRLPPRRELNEEGFQRQLATSVRALLDSAPAVGRAASSEAEQLGRTILAWDSYLPGLVSGSIAAASRSPLPSTQLVYLDHASTVLEAASQLITVAKDSGGNPRAVHLHDSLNESVRGLVVSCEEFLTILDDVASRQGHVSTLIDTLNRAQAQAEEIIQVPVDARFSDYQTRMLRIARHMDRLNQAIQLRARQPASDGEIAPLAHNLTQEYQEMCQTCKGAAATLPDVNQADQLRSAVRGVGTACISLVQATSANRSYYTDSYGSGTGQQLMLSRNKSIAELDKRAEFLDAKLRNLISLLETHGPGTQACLQSASTVSGIISDLDTTILFASSGTLHPPIRDDVDALWADDEYGQSRLVDRNHPGYLALSNITDGTGLPSRAGSKPEMHNSENFTPLRESIARTARALVDDTQSLVSGTGEDQARLATTAHIAVERITQLADVVKRGAAVIGPGQPDTQVELLTPCRDVAIGLRSLFLSAGKVQGLSSIDPVYDEVRSNAQVVISNVGQLLQTLKSIEEDERRGIRSLELAARYCREQAKLLPSSKDPDCVLTPTSLHKSTAHSAHSVSATSASSSLIARYLAPDDLARAAGGPVQSAVSKAILASNTQTQRDVIHTTSATRDAVTDLVTAARSLLRYSEITAETKSACAIITRELAEEFAVLLDTLKDGLCTSKKPEVEKVSSIARRIADISHSLINLVDSLREGPRLVMYFRASSPEWRDVAEKFIGRHVAYHHHYVSNYALAGLESTHKSVYIRPTCYPFQLSYDQTSEQSANDEAECRVVEAITQLNSSLEKCSADNKLAQSLLVSARSVAASVQNLIRTARTVVSIPPTDAVDRARAADSTSQKSTSSAALWRTELNISLATQHLCQLSKLCSETVPSTTSTVIDDTNGELSGRLILSRERLLAAVRQVATAGAQLLLATKLRKEALMSADIRKLKSAGQAVKESTDLLAEAVQRSSVAPISSTPSGITWPMYSNEALLKGIHTKAQIHSQQMELKALESQLARLQQAQLS